MSAYKTYPKTKDSGVEWLGDVPCGWDVKPLKVVASFNDDVLAENFGEDQEIEYVDIGSVSLETGIESTETFRFGDAPSRARRKVRDGDVIASTVRTYLKAIAPIVAPPSNLIVSTGFAVIRPRDGLNSHFAKFSLQSNYFVDEVISRSTGVSYPAINASEMATISLTLPPLPEQRQIAAFLDRECGKLDALQAKQQRLIELLTEKRQALISHAVTRGLDPAAPLQPSGIEWLGDVPAHWVCSKVKWVSKCVKTGGTPTDPASFTDDPEVPWLTPGDFTDNYLIISPKKFITKTALAARDAPHFHPSAIFVVGIGATLGKVARLANSRSASANQQINAIIPTSRIDSSYLLLSLVGQGEQMKTFSNASTLGIMNQEKTKAIHLVLPPLAEQRAIVAHLDEKCGKIDRLKAKAERAIELLKERRSALISAAVTGKIDVRQVIKHIEPV